MLVGGVVGVTIREQEMIKGKQDDDGVVLVASGDERYSLLSFHRRFDEHKSMFYVMYSYHNTLSLHYSRNSRECLALTIM